MTSLNNVVKNVESTLHSINNLLDDFMISGKDEMFDSAMNKIKYLEDLRKESLKNNNINKLKAFNYRFSGSISNINNKLALVTQQLQASSDSVSFELKSISNKRKMINYNK